MSELALKPFVHGVDANPVSWLQESNRMLANVMAMLPDDDGVTDVSDDAYRKAVQENFDFALLKHQSAVDLCVDTYNGAKSNVERAAHAIKAIDREKARYERLMAIFREVAYAEVLANGRRPFKGFRGSIAIQGNGGAAPIEYAFSETAPVTKDMATTFMIDGKYLKVYVDRSAVRADLEAGIKLPFATLQPRGEGIRFRK